MGNEGPSEERSGERVPERRSRGHGRGEMRRNEPADEPREAATLRSARQGDEHAFLALFHALDTESEFMMFEPGERVIAAAAMRARIVGAAKGGRERLIVAARLAPGGATVLDGFVGGIGGPGYRNAHAWNIVLGVRRSASGRGLGRRLLDALEARAREEGIHRLGLGVLSTNERAIALYERAGFVREGLRRDATRLRSGYVDEWMMSKLL